VFLSSVAVMAVSPEGLVCYWSNALHDPPATLEGSVDVGEGRGYMLVGLPSGRGGCLLTTSLGILFLITPPASAQVGWKCTMSVHNIASFPGSSLCHLQSVVTCSVQIWRSEVWEV